jgi:hypothetical protein
MRPVPMRRMLRAGPQSVCRIYINSTVFSSFFFSLRKVLMNASVPLCAIIKSPIYIPPLIYVHTYICSCVCNWEQKEDEKHFHYQ